MTKKIAGTIRYSDIEQYPSCNFVQGPSRLNWRDIEKTINKWLDEDGLNLNPDYQRDFVWTSKQKAAFIEHILRGGNTSAPIVLNYPGYNLGHLGGMEVLDGKQRLSALIDFFDNKVKAFGFYFENFEGQIFRIGNKGVGVDYGIVDIANKIEVYNLYLALNATGVNHTPEDLNKVRKLIEQANEKQT